MSTDGKEFKDEKEKGKNGNGEKGLGGGYKDPLRHYQTPTAVIMTGYNSRLSEGAIKAPIFLSSTFEFNSAEEGEKFFQRAYHLPGDDGQPPGLIYSRINNPNIEIIEDKMVSAEKGATHALLFPSGMSAITMTVLALIGQGGRILYSHPVYGGTYFFFKEMCPQRFGIETISVDMSDLAETERVLREQKPFDLIFIETPANPTMVMTDIVAVTRLTRKYNNRRALVAVDNTFIGPVYQQPMRCTRYGADLILYSATKFIGGHSNLIAGFVLIRSAEHAAKIADYRTILGATTSPFTAWQLSNSLEDLWPRMWHQTKKTRRVVRALQEHPKIATIMYPGLLKPADGPSYKVYRKQCKGPGAVFSFVLKNATWEAAFRLLNALRIFHLAVSLGSTESLAEHPRSMTHSDMSPVDLDQCGISEGLIRVSIGMEASKDLIADLMQALDKV